MFDKNRETRDNVNDAANSVNEAAQEVKKVAQTVQTVKDHLRRNKTRYLVGTGVIVGTAVVGGAGFALGRSEITQNVDSFKLIHIQWKSPNVNIALNKPELPEPIPVRYKPTGNVFGSIRQAAKMLGMNASDISKDAQGAQELFERLPNSVFA